MTSSMKGLFKGFRYISQIFEEEKVDDIEIGFPTDVKHVAHIGSDGPSTNQPSWMNEFKPDENKPVETQSKEIQLEVNVGTGQEVSGTDSPTRQKKQHRRHRSGSGSISSPGHDPTSAAPTKPRRPKSIGGESPAREPKNADPSGAPKQSRKKKSKETSGVPDKLPKPKGSDRSQSNGGDSSEFCPSPAYDVYEDRGDGRGGAL